jgi:hypothetical protein
MDLVPFLVGNDKVELGVPFLVGNDKVELVQRLVDGASDVSSLLNKA